MAKTLSQLCDAIVTAIEGISPTKVASDGDTFQGRVGYPDADAGDRRFGVYDTYGGVRALAAPGGTVVCPDVHEVEVFVLVNYTWTSDVMARILDDGELITEALEDLRASDADIRELLLDPPDVVAESDDGLVVAARSMVVQYQRA